MDTVLLNTPQRPVRAFALLARGVGYLLVVTAIVGLLLTFRYFWLVRDWWAGVNVSELVRTGTFGLVLLTVAAVVVYAFNLRSRPTFLVQHAPWTLLIHAVAVSLDAGVSIVTLLAVNPHATSWVRCMLVTEKVAQDLAWVVVLVGLALMMRRVLPAIEDSHGLV
jgi:hypothetical protein